MDTSSERKEGRGDARLWRRFGLLPLRSQIHRSLWAAGDDVNAVTAGDELLGLGRGLPYTAAQSLSLTLWDVDDASTAEVMALFYHNYSACFQPRSGERM